MKNLFLSLALVAGFSLPVVAQSMGQSNANAQTVTTAIEFADGAKMSVTYKALNYGQGQFMERVKQERFRTAVNQNAKDNPCGSVTLNKDMVFAGEKIAAGEYGLHFLLGDDGGFIAALSTTNAEGDKEIKQFPLKLAAAASHSQRLSIQIVAGEEVDQCIIALHFGKLGMTVNGSCAKAEKKDDAAKGK